MNAKTQSNSASNVSDLDRVLHILHLEDIPHDRDMIQGWLNRQHIAAEFTDVDNEADFVKALEEKPFDIILSDNSLPGYDGLTALLFVREKFPHIPFVFVTGSMGEEAAIETMKHGATDYVLKNRLSRLIPAVQRAIRESEQKEKNRQTEEKNSEQAAIIDEARDAILVTDAEDYILFWNKGAERVYGWPASAVLGRSAASFLPTDPAKYQEAKHVLLEKGNWTGELTAANRGGNELIVESRWTLVRDKQGNPTRILIIDTDITEKKTIEAKFLRAQRMDSIGALAGGIAHDLNNALAPVIMGTELLRACEGGTDRDRFLDIITANAQRATELVQQILSFARGSGHASGPVQLRQIIDEMSKMIQETFPKSFLFSVQVSEDGLWIVQGDSTELHQVLLNLCVNARDAMPHGGRLTLSAQNFTLDARAAAATNAKPGLYVMVSVSDTGTGIPPEVLPRIFEPFFTTKTEKGMGLGLSTVAGIIQHHGGFMDIQTEFGKGTEFKVYLPALDFTETEEAKSQEAAPPTGHGELILVVDDEEALLGLTKTMLESCGYQVITAPNGMQGIARFKEKAHEIKLLITDSDMPHLNGMGTIRAIRELNPNIPVIIASGYNQDTEELRKNDILHLKNLGKPYSLGQLLLAVSTSLRH